MKIALLACTVLLFVAGLTACSGTEEPPIKKSGEGVIHHDLEPLIKRIPALADARATTWTSGTVGDDRVPGPSTYWIDAVITLEPAAADALRADLALNPVEAPVGFRTELPAGDLVGGPALDQAFTQSPWVSTARLQADGDQLVLEMIGYVN